jgi:hypothetical protein
MIKRRDFSFFELLYQSENNSMPLFSDTGENVFIPEPEKEYPPQILNLPILADVPSCCTETYLVCGLFKEQKTAKIFFNYLKTKFFRCVVLLRKVSQDNSKNCFFLCPCRIS